MSTLFVSMTYVDIQNCLPFLIQMNNFEFLVHARRSHIILMSSMCIVDNTSAYLFGVFPQFNSIRKCE
jgi:hypothetical protein